MTAPLEVLYAKRFGAGNLAVSGVPHVIGVQRAARRRVRNPVRPPPRSARRALAIGMLIFGASSVVHGLTPTFAPLVVARMAQGLGAAVLQGASLQAAVRVYDSREHALGSVQGSLMLGDAVGAPVRRPGGDAPPGNGRVPVGVSRLCRGLRADRRRPATSVAAAAVRRACGDRPAPADRPRHGAPRAGARRPRQLPAERGREHGAPARRRRPRLLHGHDRRGDRAVVGGGDRHAAVGGPPAGCGATPCAA